MFMHSKVRFLRQRLPSSTSQRSTSAQPTSSHCASATTSSVELALGPRRFQLVKQTTEAWFCFPTQQSSISFTHFLMMVRLTRYCWYTVYWNTVHLTFLLRFWRRVATDCCGGDWCRTGGHMVDIEWGIAAVFDFRTWRSKRQWICKLLEHIQRLQRGCCWYTMRQKYIYSVRKAKFVLHMIFFCNTAAFGISSTCMLEFQLLKRLFPSVAWIWMGSCTVT